MAVHQTILRYFHILNRLRRSSATFQEIDDYLSIHSELQGERLNVSQRQFQRDIKHIATIFDIEIYFNATKAVYQIDKDETSEISKRRIEALDTFNALKIGESNLPFIHFEKRKPLGTENLNGLIQSIKNSLKVSFDYKKFWENDTSHRTVEPYALKEFKNRWYVLAKDGKDERIKSFALDRIGNPVITKMRFTYPMDFNVDDYYRNCFGIISPDNQKPEEIILSFNQVQGKYIKSMPLHESQEILVDTDNELRIRLKLYLTYDFLLEILSHGDNVKVISPDELVKQIGYIYKNALNQYRE